MSISTIIGICGCSASGKTSLASGLLKLLNHRAGVISLDAYYKPFTDLAPQERKKINFDHPSSFDFELFENHIKAIRQGHHIKFPVYSFEEQRRKTKTIDFFPTSITIIDGILLYHVPAIRDLFDIKLFIDSSEKMRKRRRIERDMLERNLPLEFILTLYNRDVLPMSEKYVLPQKAFSDIILDGDASKETLLGEAASKLSKYMGNDGRYTNG
ncbi:uridine kinase [Eubacteriales bacterium OttesenSCG-928-K08]|nr:uridine kinase [Eubacteriales bacterium OttesenSCG-928-K08]